MGSNINKQITITNGRIKHVQNRQKQEKRRQDERQNMNVVTGTSNLGQNQDQTTAKEGNKRKIFEETESEKERDRE